MCSSRACSAVRSFLGGTARAEAFYDSENISRSDPHPFPLVQLFGAINMEMYDGPKHFALKSMALQAFDHTAIAEYLAGHAVADRERAGSSGRTGGIFGNCGNVGLHIVLESKRHVPLVPLAFGRAKRTFEFEGYRIPVNWTVYLNLFHNNRDSSVYSDPDRFDPDRFERGEHLKHRMAFIPQGAEPATGHRCLGLDYATFLTLAFVVLLVRDFEWQLPAQNLEYNWRKIPPEPYDGLRMRLRKTRS